MTNHPMRSSVTTERPLPRRDRAMLELGAAATMLAFYAAAIVSMTALGTLFLVMVVVALGAARVGAAGLVAKLMAPTGQLFQVFARQLWLRSTATYRAPLTPADAPRFFAMVRDLARRLDVKPPDTVVVEMHSGAWIMLKGFWRRSGKVTLGIGFDLLAGLSAAETEAVLAHELAHAKLVQRGFSRWLNKGLARLSRVAQGLSVDSAQRKQASESSDLADWNAKLFDALTVRAARLVATYSRQDEFEADRTAADACGASPIRSALLKLEALDDAASRLPWSERFARLQPSENFSKWLVGELSRRTRTDGADEPVRHSLDPYSTHPSLRDRLEALPADDRLVSQDGTALALLADPDAVAGRLAAEIQRVVAEQERRDSRRLARETQKLCKRGSTSGLQFLAIIAIAFGVITWLLALSADLAIDAVITAVASLGIGIALLRVDRYRDKRRLPIPTYGTLTWKPFDTREQMKAAEDALFTELRATSDTYKRNAHKRSFLVATSYEALEQRDYLRAHVSARLALQMRGAPVEASVAYAVAAASLGGLEQARHALATVKKEAGFRSPSTKWGAAWALIMLDDWSAEGFLQQLLEREPANATFAALLALAQLQRGKLQSAARNARTASASEPHNTDIAQLLVNILLQTGAAREAADLATPLEAIARTEAYTAFLLVRVKLMLRDTAGANEWARVLRSLKAEEHWLIALGSAFAEARLDDLAAAFFTDALATTFAPQANEGLATLAIVGGDRITGRKHLLAALKFDKATFLGGQTPSGLFHRVVARLNALHERRRSCKAWIAAVPAGIPSALAGTSVLVYAPHEGAARDHLAEVVAAMHSEPTTFDVTKVNWREAPEEQQPIRPVWPGVQTAT